MNAQQEIRTYAVRPISAKEVMQTAWNIAKIVAADYESVTAKSLLSIALKRAWAAVKVTVSVFNAYNDRKILAFLGFIFNESNKAWEKEVSLSFFHCPSPVKFGRGFLTTANIQTALKNSKITKWG